MSRGRVLGSAWPTFRACDENDPALGGDGRVGHVLRAADALRGFLYGFPAGRAVPVEVHLLRALRLDGRQTVDPRLGRTEVHPAQHLRRPHIHPGKQ
jgi:hypothetical protein